MAEDNIGANRFIKKIRIENFQSHRDTQLNLESGINLIVGSSDSGKTAILRALNFVLHNEWAPDFLRIGTDECRVAIWFSDGTMVQRIKGTKRNTVLLRYPDGTGEGFDKFGVKYPPEVVKALGNPPQDDRHGAISYGEQSAPLFLVSLTPTELPRSISELTGIDDFDEASTILSKKSKQAEKQAKECATRIAKHNDDLQKYLTLDDEISRAVSLEKRRKGIASLMSQIEDGYELYEKYSDVMRQGKEATKSLVAAQKIAAFESRLSEANVLSKEIESMEELINASAKLEKDEVFAKQALAKAEKIASSHFQDRLEAIKNDFESVKLGEDFLTEYSALMSEGKSIQAQMLQWKSAIEEKTQQVEIMRKELREAGAWCDGCNRPLLEDTCA